MKISKVLLSTIVKYKSLYGYSKGSLNASDFEIVSDSFVLDTFATSITFLINYTND